MGTYPDAPRAEFLGWCQTHEKIFVDNAAALGLTPAQTTAFKTATDGTTAALTNQEQVKQAAKVATQEAADAFTTLRASAGETVGLIKAFAESQPDPNVVYNLAQIPPPAQPTPWPPPGQPTHLTVTLDPALGALTLHWKAANPPGTTGTSYIVTRRLAGESTFSVVGVTGQKQFTDQTVPAGQTSVQYLVQGQRADSRGPVSTILTVNFGKAPGEMTTSTATAPASATSTPSVMDAIINSKPLTNGKRTPARV